ncbi:MAG: tetratricopeptide repeat protein [Bacteroidales bacterium]|nr:tetratricopeptide repeat protein [Bacteroidales bacterium]
MKNDRHIIQKYLDHELSEKEMIQFEQDLEASPELLADLNLFQEVDEAIADTDVLDFRAQLTDLRNENHRSETGRKFLRFTRPWHYAASAALALLVAIGLATILGRPLSNKDLFKKYMKPYELVLTNRAQDANINMNVATEELLMQQASRYYLLKDYEQAIFYYEKVLEANSGKMDASLYSGIAYMETDQYDKASTSFNKVIEQHDNMFLEKAEWYLGLCFLATNETDRARRQFARIASSSSYYKDEAFKILKKMQR